MSVAFMTIAEDVWFQLYDSTGTNLVGVSYNLEVTSVSAGIDVSEIDITNSLSHGYGEFVPSIAIGQFDLEGIVDDVAYPALFAVPAAHVFIQVTAYYVKPTGTNDPLGLTAKMMLKNIKQTGRVTSSGDAWKFTASGKVIGPIQKIGTDTSPALVTGVTAGFGWQPGF